MSIADTKHEIEKLNNPQFGSFAEFVFVNHVINVRNQDLIKIHRDDADFIMQGNTIDVGGRRMLNKHFTNQTIRNKTVSVFFYKDCCFINYPTIFEAKIDWSDIVSLYKAWRQNPPIHIPTNSGISFEKEYEEIKNAISSFFLENGYTTKIIYRTVSHKFGLRESPHNLLPSKLNEKGVTVYIDFKSYIRTNENIRFIIAFPDNTGGEIPRQKIVSIKAGQANVKKIDLNTIIQTKHRCYFETREELIKCFFKRYPKIE